MPGYRFQVPETIENRYELIDVIASGGMATVWRARDMRLDREVAVKRPHPAPPDDPDRPRTLREAKAAAAIGHPHLVTVFDAGEDEQGVYLVMELVEGPTLEQIADSLADGEIVGIGVQLGNALAVVHSAGIVHRDVKPANILMSPRGALLTDFGVALDSSATSRLTQPGTVYATPSYAAPEVMAGELPGPKSDVYSLAVVIYELLAGSRPFTETNHSEAPPPLEDRFLDRALREALSLEPDHRPDAAEFAANLEGASRTKAMVGVGGSTIPMQAVGSTGTKAQPSKELEAAPNRNGVYLWAAGVASVLVVFVALVLALNDRAPAGAIESSSTTSPVSTTEAMATTSSTQPDLEPTIEAARAEFVAVLEAIQPSDLKPKDREPMVKKVDEAIELTSNGAADEASKKLEEVARDIDKKLDGSDRDSALAALEQLADALGVSIE